MAPTPKPRHPCHGQRSNASFHRGTAVMLWGRSAPQADRHRDIRVMDAVQRPLDAGSTLGAADGGGTRAYASGMPTSGTGLASHAGCVPAWRALDARAGERVYSGRGSRAGGVGIPGRGRVVSFSSGGPSSRFKPHFQPVLFLHPVTARSSTSRYIPSGNSCEGASITSFRRQPTATSFRSVLSTRPRFSHT